jgi:7-cyano-7-deazaguanine synthase
MSRAVALLSAGLDSTVTLATFLAGGGAVALALTFDYGQRAAKRELERAAAVSDHYRVRHEVVELPWLARISSASLNRPGAPFDVDKAESGPQSLWVPNRNGVFVNIAASYAEELRADTLLIGLNVEESRRFPDNTVEFVAAENAALALSTLATPLLLAPTANLSKAEIITLGRELGAPLELVWPCYESGETLCWDCPSCRLFQKALDEAGAADWFGSIMER